MQKSIVERVSGGGQLSFKQGFTLAEVLITLGIIGIVASMTLPALVNKYQKQQTVAQLQKVYSLIAQAIKNAERDYESPAYWDYSLSSSDFNNKYIKPYFKVIKEYKTSEFPSGYHTYGTDGKLHDGFFDYFHNPKIVLNDGTMITIQTNQTADKKRYVVFIIDLNGFKKPNQYGKDLFAISVQPDGGMLPYGVGTVDGGTTELGYKREEIVGGSDYRACNRKQGGAFCAALIVMDGWQIKDDYPW